MTTDQDLRDLLSAEAAGAPASLPSWDAVERRGRHHRRARRLRRSAALAAVVAAVAFGSVDVIEGNDDDREPVIADDPTAPGVVPPFGSRVREAIAANRYLIVTSDLIDRDDWYPGHTGEEYCDVYGVRVTESADEVVVEVVDATGSDVEPWVECVAPNDYDNRDVPRGVLKGTVALAAPLGDRRLTEANDDSEVVAGTMGSVLFPTDVPEPFDRADWSPMVSGGVRFRAGDLLLEVANSTPVDAAEYCLYGLYQGVEPETITVRGAVADQGSLCTFADGTYQLRFRAGDGQDYSIWLGLHPCCIYRGPAPYTTDDVVAIAEGLEPYEG